MKNNQTLFCNGALVHDVSAAALRGRNLLLADGVRTPRFAGGILQ